MIGVIAKLKVKSGQEANFETEAKALVAKVNAHEEGCLFYALFKDKEPGHYTFMEQYLDKAALDAHGQTEYFLAAQPILGACLSAAPNMQILKSV